MNDIQIDELIAQKIMGWRTLAEILGNKPDEGPKTWVTPDGQIERLPHYCSDIFTAWFVLDWVKEQKYQDKFISVLQELIYQDDGRKLDPSWLMFELNPSIICRAALRLIGVEIK